MLFCIVQIYMNKEITSGSYSILFKQNGFDRLTNYLNSKNYSKIFIHIDNNTKKFCLDVFLAKITLEKFDLIESCDGEENKNIDSCLKLWEIISNNGGDRNSLIINLGGGVVTDMGGFIASTYKRGIDYINVPTTLLSMVDASIGGKTGIDFGILKNQIGTFHDPQMVIIESDFLKTLKTNQISSGYAEIFKHSLIYDLKTFKFSISHVNSIKKHVDSIYKKIEINENQIESIIDLLIHDKKNSHGKINFVLLEDVAKPIYDVQVNKSLIKESFKYYLS